EPVRLAQHQPLDAAVERQVAPLPAPISSTVPRTQTVSAQPLYPRNVSRSPGRACAATARSRGSTTAITGYPPVVGWSARNTTGCPPDGTCTAPVTSPSLGSSWVRYRVSTGPDRRSPIRLLCAVTWYG